MKNKIFIILFLISLFSLNAYASNILVYDTETGKVKEYLKCQNTPDYAKRIDILINPVLPNCDIKHMKVKDGQVIEISQEEKDIMASNETKTKEEAENKRIENLDISIKELSEAFINLGIIKKEDLINAIKNLSD